MTEALKTQVLAWINDVRQALDLDVLYEIPKGVRMEGESCPVAHALAGVVLSTGSQTSPIVDERTALRLAVYSDKEICPGSEYEQPELKHPAFVSEFVASFDRGEMPELDLEAERPYSAWVKIEVDASSAETADDIYYDEFAYAIDNTQFRVVEKQIWIEDNNR